MFVDYITVGPENGADVLLCNTGAIPSKCMSEDSLHRSEHGAVAADMASVAKQFHKFHCVQCFLKLNAVYGDKIDATSEHALRLISK